MKRPQIPQKLVYKKFHVHEKKLRTQSCCHKFIKNLLPEKRKKKNTCEPNNRALNHDWKTSIKQISNCNMMRNKYGTSFHADRFCMYLLDCLYSGWYTPRFLLTFFFKTWGTEVSCKSNPKQHREYGFDICFVANCSTAFKPQNFKWGSVRTYFDKLFLQPQEQEFWKVVN